MPFVKIAKTCSAPLNKMIARAKDRKIYIESQHVISNMAFWQV